MAPTKVHGGQKYEVVLANWTRIFTRVVVTAESEHAAFEAAKREAKEHPERLKWEGEALDTTKITVFAFKPVDGEDT